MRSHLRRTILLTLAVLTDIHTTEPPPELFVLPTGYQNSSHLLWSFELPEAELRRLGGSSV
jgi:hypothetical protein